jgi:hypothetical protein
VPGARSDADAAVVGGTNERILVDAFGEGDVEMEARRLAVRARARKELGERVDRRVATGLVDRPDAPEVAGEAAARDEPR